MSVLCRSGTSAPPTRVATFHTTRIAGVAHDAARIYVLQWHVGTAGLPYPEGALRHVHYGLEVFRLADGQQRVRLKVDAPNETAVPGETFGPGPLKIVPGGVEAFGHERLIPDQGARANGLR